MMARYPQTPFPMDWEPSVTFNPSISGIWLCDLCGKIETPSIVEPHENHCRHCAMGIVSYWTGDQLNAKIKALDEVMAERDRFSEALQIVKDCCDRDWKDETPHQIAVIASNAMFWRNEEIRKLRDALGSA